MTPTAITFFLDQFPLPSICSATMSPRPSVRPLSLFLVALLSVPLVPASAAVSLAPLFREGAILQRDQPVPVWGKAAPGEQVTVGFGGQSLVTRADEAGRWSVRLAPLAASDQPRELVVSGENTLRVRDVLVGEVWLCSGQSNMAWTVSQIGADTATLSSAADPLLRQFKITQTLSSTPLDTLSGDWVASRTGSVGDFSAVAYFFARELRTRLGVPVGLINSSWGGTQIESWLSPAAIAESPHAGSVAAEWAKRIADYPAAQARYESLLAKWESDRAKALAANKPFTRNKPRRPEGAGTRWEPGAIYHAMIHPLRPAAIRGVIWYQGETNAPRYDEYRDLFPRLIQQWRADFNQPALPFYFVQLANIDRSASVDPTARQWAFLREAQSGALRLPATGQALAIDIGEANNIHPRNKQEVGRRLALLALSEVHALPLPAYGPRFERAERSGEALRIRFLHADGLESSSGANLTGFELAGEDRVFHDASARIEGDTVLVSSPAVPAPVAVRYAFKNNPPVSLKNRHGLPAEPFRTDTW